MFLKIFEVCGRDIVGSAEPYEYGPLPTRITAADLMEGRPKAEFSAAVPSACSRRASNGDPALFAFSSVNPEHG
jgi:hypothetical protein